MSILLFASVCLFVYQSLGVTYQCPEFEYRELDRQRLAFTLNPVTSSWDEASKLCRTCIGGRLADISNAMVLAEKSSIYSYWIGHYDGGELVPNLVWYTGESPSVTVLPSTLTANRGFVCSDFEIGTPHAVALLLDYRFTDQTIQPIGEISFEQKSGLENQIQIVLKSEILPVGNYLLDIDTFGDMSRGCNFDIQKLETQNLSTSIYFDNSRNVSVMSSCFSLYGGQSILGRCVVLRNMENRILGCGVIGIGNLALKQQQQTNKQVSLNQEQTFPGGNRVRENQQLTGSGSTNQQLSTNQGSTNQQGYMTQRGGYTNQQPGTNQQGVNITEQMGTNPTNHSQTNI